MLLERGADLRIEVISSRLAEVDAVDGNRKPVVERLEPHSAARSRRVAGWTGEELCHLEPLLGDGTVDLKAGVGEIAAL